MDTQRNDQTQDKASTRSEPVLCLASCGFFGNPATNNYCSKCWKQQQQQQQQQPEHAQNGNPCSGAPAGHQVQQGHGPPGYLRYTPSPLPRWEATPRRHEYFSGEYRYSYPTPVREGIYRMATDANRLTTIFSEENPNACAIV